MLVRVCTCQNATLLEITCHSSYNMSILSKPYLFLRQLQNVNMSSANVGSALRVTVMK